MKLMKEEMIIKVQEAMKKNIIPEGWEILFLNKNEVYPVDYRAIKGLDKLVGYFSNNASEMDPHKALKGGSIKLKEESQKALAHPISMKFILNDVGSVRGFLDQQIH